MARRVRVCMLALEAISAKVFLVPLMERLEREGFEVHLVTSPGTDEFEEVRQGRAWTTHAIPLPWGASPLQDLLAVGRLTAHLRRQRYTVIHAHMFKCGFLSMIAGALMGSPVRLYHNHGLIFLIRKGVLRWLLRMADCLTCSLAHRVYYVSFSNRDSAIQERVVSPQKARVLAGGSIRGLQVDRFIPNDRIRGRAAEIRHSLGICPLDTVVGYVGRPVEHKGFGVMLRTWVEFFRDDPSMALITLPSTPDDVRQWIGELPPNVHAPGWVPDVAEYYAAMDMVALPSLHEGLGYSLLEGNAAGLPVIGSSISGILDAVEHEVNGLLVPASDRAALADAIVRLRSDPELRRRLGQAGRERVRQRYDPERVLRALVDEYRELIRGLKEHR
ncbi:MAG: glycosyltransferase [Armatimonadetes bacterium]|nr:glycosyltransferase [Armatimonadota bacterium]